MKLLGNLCKSTAQTERFTLLLLSLLFSGMVMANDPVAEGKAFAERKDGCGLDHGYVCRDQVEDKFVTLESQRQMVSGNYLKAWQVAMQDFVAIEQMDQRQKDLKHYKFGFTENDKHYIVFFQALLLPAVKDGVASSTIRSTFGLSTRYWIDKATMTINKRLFYKT